RGVALVAEEEDEMLDHRPNGADYQRAAANDKPEVDTANGTSHLVTVSQRRRFHGGCFRSFGIWSAIRLQPHLARRGARHPLCDRKQDYQDQDAYGLEGATPAVARDQVVHEQGRNGSAQSKAQIGVSHGTSASDPEPV